MQIREIKQVVDQKPLYNNQAFEQYVEGKFNSSLESLKQAFKKQFAQIKGSSNQVGMTTFLD